MSKRGNPNWQQRYGEPTKPVRLPIPIANTVKQMLDDGRSKEEILAWVDSWIESRKSVEDSSNG